MKALVAALALTLAIVPQASASSTPKDKAAAPVANYITLEPIAAPIVVRGVVVNYVFVTLRVELVAGTNAQTLDALRAKEPHFRDALVRAAHRTPFTVPANLTVVDEQKLTAAFLAEARAIGGRSVSGVKITEQIPKSTRVIAAR
jgi:hypothetical protein